MVHSEPGSVQTTGYFLRVGCYQAAAQARFAVEVEHVAVVLTGPDQGLSQPFMAAIMQLLGKMGLKVRRVLVEQGLNIGPRRGRHACQSACAARR